METSIIVSDMSIEEHTLTGLYPSSEYHAWISAKSIRGEGGYTHVLVSTQDYVPSEPLEIKTKVINSTSLFVEWKPPMQDENHGFIIGYQIYIHGEVNEEELVAEEHSYIVTNESALNSLVTDLQPDSTYKVQVAAMTRKSRGIPSRNKVVRTPEGVPSRPLLQIRLFADESLTVAINATWINSSKTPGGILGWRLRYGKRPNFCVNFENHQFEKLDMKEIILNGYDTNEYTVRRLENGFKYQFRLAARNDVGYSQEALAEVNTPEAPPTGPPTNISFHFITADTVILTWDVPEAFRCSNDRLLGYILQFHKNMDDYFIMEKNSSTPKMVISELEEDTSYNFRVCGYTTEGIGPFSENMYFSTITEIVRAPSNVQALATSNNSMEVWWDEVSPKAIVGYRIYYTRNETMALDMWSCKDVQITYSAELKNLVHFASYYIQVACRTKEGGFGRLSKIVQVELKPKEVPTQFEFGTTFHWYTSISWNAPRAFKPHYYKVGFDYLFEMGVSFIRFDVIDDQKHRTGLSVEWSEISSCGDERKQETSGPAHQ
ncbi:unnamed protein product [Darwinula stevensoni]|uniref:Fibronectin type-III domain-containing protein n=1 Tax=Darwinula stevensoni TaxID=69355 RepID=A0A7R9AB16_9CRUS|nr:unnamed protein product [Darwinula stevensoni]CAG0898985.1 unnamed protein product [Darwinula stevensoni]